MNFLGPYDDIWESVCLKEFGYDVIHKIDRAADSGLLSINKFWAFENYNYMVFSSTISTSYSDSGQVESRYLSAPVFALEIVLGVFMAAVCVVTVAGNSAVFVAILVDPINKKSVYQYFQVCWQIYSVNTIKGKNRIGIFNADELMFGRCLDGDRWSRSNSCDSSNTDT